MSHSFPRSIPPPFTATLALAAGLAFAGAPRMDLDHALDETIAGRTVPLSAIQPATDSVTFLRALAARFASDTQESRRERIVALLREHYPNPMRIQDRPQLSALLEGSATLRDRGTDRALGLLMDRADSKVLSTMSDAILRPLEAHPFAEWLDLAVRAKPQGALAVLRRMATNNPKLKEDGHWMQAMAANGDKSLEASYIASFQTTDDAQRKMDLAETLRRIGTRNTLAALAQEMRTPMVYALGRVFQTPLRETISIQLRIAFPEWKPESTCNTDAYYAEIEAYCQKEFGTKWKTKRPPVEYSGPLEHGFQPIPPEAE